MARKTYAERKALGLVLSASDRREADAIIADIHTHGGSPERWDRADRTPAIAARVGAAITGYRHTPSDRLEQFYRYGDTGMARGGKVWLRPLPPCTCAPGVSCERAKALVG